MCAGVLREVEEMKAIYIILLMGVAAVGGGLLVRYHDRPAEIAIGRPVPPAVVAPPVAPREPVPAPSMPAPSPDPPVAQPASPVAEEIPAPLSERVHVGKPSAISPRSSTAPRVSVASRPSSVRRVPSERPAVIALQTPSPVRAPKPVQVATLPPPPPPPVATPTPTPFVEPPAAPLTPLPQPNRVTLPAGMLVAVRINEALSSDRNGQGDVFTGTLEKPLAADGFVIAERGARVRGEVIETKRAGRVQGVSELTIRLKEITTTDGQRVSVLSKTWRKQGATSTGTDAAKIGGGAALGAIIGAIAGGGKGAGIGAGVGGAAGAGDVLLTRGGPALIKSETSITFSLERPVEITEKQ